MIPCRRSAKPSARAVAISARGRCLHKLDWCMPENMLREGGLDLEEYIGKSVADTLHGITAREHLTKIARGGAEASEQIAVVEQLMGNHVQHLTFALHFTGNAKEL